MQGVPGAKVLDLVYDEVQEIHNEMYISTVMPKS